MKVKQFVDKLMVNWPAKVGCFLMALFFYIFYQVSLLDSRSITIPLSVTDSNGLVVASDIPKNVKITLRGKDVALAALTTADFEAYINLNYISEEGNYKQPVLLTLSPSALEIDPLEVKVSPDYVMVRVEEQITASTKINVLKAGNPAYGYEIKSISVEPKEALISGGKSVVQKYDRLQTEKVLIEGQESTVTKTVGLINNSSNIKLIENNPVNVEIVIGPILITQEFKGMKINYINVNPGLELSKKTDTVNVVLFGKLIDIEKYSEKSQVITVDCSEVTQAGTAELKIDYGFPRYIEFDEEPLQTVTCEFIEKGNEAGSEGVAQ